MERKTEINDAAEAETERTKWRGIEAEFRIPIFDFGESSEREAEALYMRAVHRLAELAVNIRSEARSTYRTYRAAYDISMQYRREVLPLRKIISDETLLQYNAMIADPSELLVDARNRLTSNAAAIEAKRDFWLAAVNLRAAVIGGGAGADGEAQGAATAAAPPVEAGGH